MHSKSQCLKQIFPSKLIIDTYSTYAISANGQVWSFKSKQSKILSGQVTDRGYISIRLYNKDGFKDFKLHRLVAWAFKGLNINDKTVEINHIDGDKTHNCVDNIEIVTHAQNMLHAFKTGLVVLPNQDGKNNHQYKHGRYCK